MNKMTKERAVLSLERLDRLLSRFWCHNISGEVTFSVRFVSSIKFYPSENTFSLLIRKNIWVLDLFGQKN